jgi:uncharacterized protein involved in exopolysaccharide biosynthesis
MLIVRILVTLSLWFVVFSGGVLYTFNKTRVYQASGLLQLLERQPHQYIELDALLEPADSQTVSDSATIDTIDEDDRYRSEVALNTEMIVLKSNLIVSQVERRLVDDERNRFMAPYVDAMELSGPLTPSEIIAANRSVELKDHSRIVEVRFRHPDPVMAARVANLIMDEYINHNLTLEIDGYMKMVEDLRIRLDQSDELIAEQSAQYEASQVEIKKEAGDGLLDSFDADLETAKQALVAHIALRTKLYSAMREAKTRLNLVNPHAIIIDYALPPFRHYSPNIWRSLSIFLGGAFILSSGFFLLTSRSRKSTPPPLIREEDSV